MKTAAEDPATIAELLMLFRMILVDGEERPAGMEALQRICREEFGVGPDTFPALMAVVERMGRTANTLQNVAVYRAFERNRRVALARRMIAIAHADDALKSRQDRFLVRLLDILDLERADLAGELG